MQPYVTTKNMEASCTRLLRFIVITISFPVGRTGGGPSAFTDSHRPVFRGEDVVLRCEPPETPSFVLWRKGDDPQRSPVLIKQQIDGSLSGSCEYDGSCEMGSNYSLIIRNVQIADEGTYICVFKDLHGFIEYSLTNLTIHDRTVTTMTTSDSVIPTDMEKDDPGSGWKIDLVIAIVILAVLGSLTVFCWWKIRRRPCWTKSNTLLPLRFPSCLVNSNGSSGNVSGTDSEDLRANDAKLPIIPRSSDKCYSFDNDLQTCKTGHEILEYFIESGLHPFEGHYAVWKKRRSTIIVCLMRQNNGHPDKLLMREFKFEEPAQGEILEIIKNEINSTENRNMKIFTNFSPCDTDEHKFRSQLWKLKVDLDVDLKLLFPAFYIDIRRPTCDSCDHPRHPQNESQRNFQELQALDSKPFEKQDWDDLIELLMKYDEQVNDVSENLFELRYGEKYGRWRDWGDEQMKQDFAALSEGF